jgi:hypothetical protein
MAHTVSRKKPAGRSSGVRRFQARLSPPCANFESARPESGHPFQIETVYIGIFRQPRISDGNEQASGANTRAGENRELSQPCDKVSHGCVHLSNRLAVRVPDCFPESFHLTRENTLDTIVIFSTFKNP